MPSGANSGPQLISLSTTRCAKAFNMPSNTVKKPCYAMQFARDLDPQSADNFVGMYVNERTLDYGPDGREAVRRLLDMGHKAGIIGPEAKVDWV